MISFKKEKSKLERFPKPKLKLSLNHNSSYPINDDELYYSITPSTINNPIKF